MTVTSISRDQNNNVSLVRMTVTDTLSTVATSNYITNQQVAINSLNMGTWGWNMSDVLLVAASDGNAIFTFQTDFTTLVQYGSGGGGGVTPTQVQENAFNQGVDSGVQNAYDVAVTPAITVPYDQMLLSFEPQAGNNSPNVTIALNGGAPLTVFSYNGSLPLQNDIESTNPTFFIFSAANNAWFLINPQQLIKIPYYVSQGDYLYYPDQGVAANVYVATPSIASSFQVPVAPLSGQPFVFIPANTNNGASTLNYNGNGALAIQYNGAALSGGEMVANRFSLIFYDGTQYQLINSQNISAITPAALTKTNDTNVTLTLGGTPATSLLQATSLTLGWTGTLALTRGGLAASLTASNGGIFYSTASAGAILGGTATAQQLLLSGASTTPQWSTTTYPLTNAINTIMYASSANVMGVITPVNSAVMISSAGGVPSMSTTLPSGLSLGTPSALVLTNATGLLVGGGGTGNSTFTAYSVICAGTTATGAFQNVSGVGTSGQVLTSNGAAALPTWQAAGGGSPWSSGAGTGSAKGGDGTCTAGGNYSLSWGSNSGSASSTNDIAMGNGCSASGGSASVAIGINSNASASSSVAIGNTNNAGGNNSTCFGYNNNPGANGTNAIVLGVQSGASGTNAVAIGYGAFANHTQAMAFCTDGNANFYIGGSASSQISMTAAYYTFGQYVAALAGVKAILGIDNSQNVINYYGTADQSYSLQVPTTGFSITIGPRVKTLILNPAGTLATGTITMPAAPVDGQEIRFSTTQIITGLTVSPNAGQTISNAPTTIAAGQGFGYIYNLSGTNWFRIY